MAPGNPGIAAVATLHEVDPLDGAAVADLAVSLGVDLVVVGPEAPLVAGVADAVEARGIAVFGPSAGGRAARGLQGVRQGRHGRRGGARRPRAFVCTTAEEAAAALDELGAPYVVKDDGLAAGKGVVVTDSRDEAVAHARGRVDGGRVVIEEYLDGPEVSLFAHHRRLDRLPDAAGPGLQADLRRRRRPQHRRDGRLHATGLGARRPGRRGARHRRAPDRPGDVPPRHAVQGPALHRPGPHLPRRPRRRVQRPVRRPRDPAAAGAARRRPLARAADGRGHRDAGRRAAARVVATGPRSPS